MKSVSISLKESKRCSKSLAIPGPNLTSKYALWLDFRMIDENALHRTDRRIENASEGITLQIEKKTESAESLSVYIYLIMDAQLNVKDRAFHSIDH